jgi:hypothetical protein
MLITYTFCVYIYNTVAGKGANTHKPHTVIEPGARLRCLHHGIVVCARGLHFLER